MKATEANFLKFLQGTKQFIIPIYQRTYSWTLSQCQQLWDDIQHAAKNDSVSGHFVGSVVYIERGLYQISSVPRLLVIDGQQRLTTISLILSALGKVIEETRPEGIDITRKKINNYYLFNSEEEGDDRYKLFLTQRDKDTFIRLIEDKDPPVTAAPRVIENYRFFEDKIRKSGNNLGQLFHGISKLIIVDVSLNREHDNPQLIFESLNSTGLDLSQADLIRNFVLMGLEHKEQEEIYNTYWYPMEQSFNHGESGGYFDRFMRDYLTVRTGRIPNLGDVYSEFKLYERGKGDRTMHTVIADVYDYSKRYVRIAFSKAEDPEINFILTDINTLKVDVAYPFLLELYDDYEQGRLTRDEFLEALKLVESYVFRRAICGIPTNSLNKTFANLGKEIKKERYLESLKAVFLLKDSYRRFPLDEEFRREFVVKDVYNFRSRNYLLRKLENYDRKEMVNVESYTIEHILPQNENLSSAWQEELGTAWREVQERYLHTIGNLTLTGYNSELSDRPFVEKREMKGGFADSPIRLNRGLAKLEHWNEEEIIKRADELSNLVAKVWSAPELSPEELAPYRNKPVAEGGQTYSLETHGNYLQGSMLDLFEALRKRILNLDTSVKEEFKKLYIAYKSTTNFVDIIPQKSRLILSLNISLDEIIDPKLSLKDVANQGRWGNGDTEARISTLDEIDDAMSLIRQAFEKQREEEA
jgi:uncharacterized protein with ParB-like and HNH nuclease domain/predicted transport protein